AVRLQRFVQSEMDMGIQPVILVKREEHAIKKMQDEPPSPWAPGMKEVPIEHFKPNRQLSYLLPTVFDKVGLKKTFKEHRCDFVHGHNVACAYYSYRLGLPTLYDDWEYNLEYFDYQTRTHGVGLRPLGSALLSIIRRMRAKEIVRELIQNLPVIVTNDEVKLRYRELGAKSVWRIPNVPLAYEREYAFAVDVEKREEITTCYVGALSADERRLLRNTSGVRRLWIEQDIGDLLVLEGENCLAHLDVLRKLRECHFNLLFWKPLYVHRYFLQNKAFLAAVVGVPTIISSSLKATIKLLGEYAHPVNSLRNIPTAINAYSPREYLLNSAHIWEHYQQEIKDAYEEALRI
ncbi:MAG: hypothetical protein JSV58_00905, partial [Candidatus Bathyarchaeota archaeon]